MSIEGKVGHRGVVYCDAFQSKTVLPEIGGDSQREYIQSCIGVVGVGDSLIDRDEMTVVVEGGSEAVDRVYGNGNGCGQRIGGN